MDDDWPYKFRCTFLDLQAAYKISDRSIINILTDASNGYNVRSRRSEFVCCKIRMVFENSAHRELPLHSSCYGILGDIIKDETKKYYEGFGLPKEDFLLKLAILIQLILSIEKDWKIRERSQQELANYFNDLVRKEKRKISHNRSPALYDGFLKRWNERFNPQWIERSAGSLIPPKEKRRRITSDTDQPNSPQTFPTIPDNSNPATPTFEVNSSPGSVDTASLFNLNYLTNSGNFGPTSETEIDFSMSPFSMQAFDDFPHPFPDIFDKDQDKEFTIE